VTPGSGEYVIGMPLLDKVVVSLSNGVKLKIQTHQNNVQQLFLDHITLDDVPYTSLYFKHSELLKGTTIDFYLGIVPHPYNYTIKQLPYSMSLRGF